MYQGNIGDGTGLDQTPRVPLQVGAGQTVTVSNLAASTAGLVVEQYQDDPSPGSIAAGSSNSYTSPVILSAPGGVASVQITGGNY